MLLDQSNYVILDITLQSFAETLKGLPIPGEDDQPESMEPVSKKRKGAKSVSAEFTDYCRQPK